MEKDPQDKLYAKYPKIFRQKDLTIRESAMPWGICCGIGWFTIIDELCANIEQHIENKNWNIKHKKERGELPQDAPNFPQIEATQVKEKFGGLRFYVNYSDEYIDGLISMAESMSLRTCEFCGNPGLPNEEGWISTQCDPCRAQDEERRKKQLEEYQSKLTVKMKDVTVAP